MTATNQNRTPRPKGTGSVYLQKGSSVWWIKYYRNGKPYRESSHTQDESKARGLLKQRLAEITVGSFVGPAERIRVVELAEDFFRDYRINGRRSLCDAEARWRLHLQPFFGAFRAVEVSSDLVARYVDSRQQEGAENATINRELACLKGMYHLGQRMTPPKVQRVPVFPKLKENNVRQGFLEDAAYSQLLNASSELWFRLLVEVGRTYGWRRGEFLRMRVKDVDLLAKTLRLEPGTTKNQDGREVTMTETIYRLIGALIVEKKPDDFVFTRANGTPVRDFRKTWRAPAFKQGSDGSSAKNARVQRQARSVVTALQRTSRIKG